MLDEQQVDTYIDAWMEKRFSVTNPNWREEKDKG